MQRCAFTIFWNTNEKPFSFSDLGSTSCLQPLWRLSDRQHEYEHEQHKNDVGVEEDSSSNADTGADTAMPDCSETVACPTPTDDTYTLSCVENVCVSACTASNQDNDMDGTCTADCSASDCDDRGCDDTSGEALCVCPLGTFLDGELCTLSPIVLYPEFAVLTDWTVEGAIGEASATDHLGNPGRITVPSDNLCEFGTTVSQSVYIPEIGQTKIVVEAVSDCTGGFCSTGALPIVLLGEHRFYASEGGYDTLPLQYTYCVPESAKGQILDFQLRTQVLDYCSFDRATLRYASADIISDDTGECGPPNAFNNGNFQATNDGTHPGWVFDGDSSTNAEVLSSGGNNYLNLVGTLCSRPTITARTATTSSADPNMGRAISIRYRTAMGSKMTMRFNRTINSGAPQVLARGAELPNSAAWADATFCLPTDLLDTEISWSAEVRSTANGGSCSIGTELDLDEVKFLEDARCATSAETVTNGDFESAAFRWIFTLDADDGASNVDGDAEIRIVNNNTVGFLQANTKCASPSITGFLDVPTTGVNALAFDYIYRPFTEPTLVGQMAVGSSLFDFLEYTTFNRTSVCLPPGANGLIQSFRAKAGHSGSCSPTGTPPVANPSEFQIDNLELVDDPTCP